MERFNEFAATEAAPQFEGKKAPKAGKVIKALYVALASIGGKNTEAAAHAASFEALDEEKLQDVKVTGPEAHALSEFWVESKDEILSAISSESPEERELAKQLIANMEQAVDKVEQVAVLHETFEHTKEELDKILADISAQQQQLEAYGVEFTTTE